MSAKNAVVNDMTKPKLNKKSKLQKLKEMRAACKAKLKLAETVANRIEFNNINIVYRLERKIKQKKLSTVFTTFVHSLVEVTNKARMENNVGKKGPTPEYIGMKAAVLKLVKLYEE